MFSWLANAWRVPELRQRVLFTAMILAIYRLGSWIPAPGVDSETIENYFSGRGGTILGLLNLFSGGALSQFSLFALGIMPYVTASIILQLMTVVIPRLAELQKEGEAGYAKITQYTRYLTVMLAAAQATGYAFLFRNQGALDAGSGEMVLIIVSLTAGTVLLMWMGELITKRGVGNGISILIFASILVGAPIAIAAWWNGGPMEKLFYPVIALGVCAAVVFVQEGQRRIPIQYAKRMVGRRMTAGGSTYLPLRVNMAGVIPIIFAAAILAFPPTMAQYFPAIARLRQRVLPAGRLDLPLDRGADDRRLHVLLHCGPVQPGRPGGQPAQVRRVHPGDSPGTAHGRVPRPRAQQAHVARLAVPRHRRGPAEPLHRLRRLLASERRSARGHVRSDRRRRRAGHHAADGVADDDALLRGLPEVASSLVRILILGPQGSGKGTQAKLIAAAHGVPHVATGEILRSAVAEGTELGLRVQPVLERGDLVPDDLMVELIRARLAVEDGFVLDGFPRTVPQAEALDAMLDEIGKPLDVVLLLGVSDDISLARLLDRRAEEGRTDDAPDAIRNRLRLYHELTEPVVERYREEGRLVAVDGERTVEEVAGAIEAALEQVGAQA